MKWLHPLLITPFRRRTGKEALSGIAIGVMIGTDIETHFHVQPDEPLPS
jgi:hypothetical protein